MIDLHVHTTFSDGILTPEEIVRLAKSKGLTAVAITDHDTVKGIREAVDAGKRLGIEVIPGIEVSSLYEEQKVHILGLFVNHNSEDLIKELGWLERGRLECAKKTLDNFEKEGFSPKRSYLEKEGCVGKIHVAQALIGEKNFLKSEVFIKEHFEGENSKYIEPPHAPAEKVIDFIKKSRGMAIIAHPAKNIKKDQEGFIRKLKSLGLDGVEVFTRKHTTNEAEKFKKIAQKLNMIITGGSDYHHPYVKAKLGHWKENKKIPYNILSELKKRF